MSLGNSRFLKPKLRPCIRYDLEDMLARVDSIYQNCLNCLNFDEGNEVCKLADLRPPARVIAYGCKAWEEYNNIPF